MPPATGVAEVPQPPCHVIVGLCFALIQASACALEDFIRRNEQEVIPSEIRVQATIQILQYTDIYRRYFQFLFKGRFLWLLGLSSMFSVDNYLFIRLKKGDTHKRPSAYCYIAEVLLHVMESLCMHSQHNDAISNCIKQEILQRTYEYYPAKASNSCLEVRN
jgi:hypothetical protein